MPYRVVSSPPVFKLPKVVKWVEKEERLPRRQNLWRDEYSGARMRKIPQNGDLGVFENLGASQARQAETTPSGVPTPVSWNRSKRGPCPVSTSSNNTKQRHSHGLRPANPDKRGYLPTREAGRYNRFR